MIHKIRIRTLERPDEPMKLAVACGAHSLSAVR
jgi:hypothetical protein